VKTIAEVAATPVQDALASDVTKAQHSGRPDIIDANFLA
jgi:hypothetical protein